MFDIKNNVFHSIQQSCILCGARNYKDYCICEDCLKDLPFINNGCEICGIPVDNSTNICGKCITTPPTFQSTISLLNYDPPVDYLVKNLKYRNQTVIAELIGKLIGEKISHRQQKKPDCIIPIPLHPNRLKKRGFNQALEIARPISRKLRIPINTNAFSRIIDTKPQFELNASDRTKNLKNAFQQNHKINVKHVAIIDDVMTTGSTVDAFSNLLIESGINKIEVWTGARAIT